MTLETIGRYKVERRIARGGMAVIYLANDPLMKRLVAIKVLPRQLTFDPQFRTRFRREVEAIAALEHPGIVPIYDFGEENEQPYYVMRYMPGGSLTDRLRKESISLFDSARIVRQIASALDASHRKGIVHRDIKPGNILFDTENNAYLSDFGIVKFTSESATFTGNTIIGTPSYMSPELVRGDTDIDGRSDIYALGVLLFRIWTGVLPFSASSPLGIAMKHITELVPSILDFKPDIPFDCDVLLGIAMAKDRKDRFSTAAEMATVLDRIVSNTLKEPELTPGIGAAPSGEFGLPYSEGSPGAVAVPRPTQGPIPAVHNLPVQPSSFIGRHEELLEIANRLENPTCRLLTLLGPGGIGKTRLAIQAAKSELYDYRHGIFFVPLAPVSAVSFIVPALAEIINLSFYGQADLKIQLINYLRNKQMLLVLDNFEHLIEGTDLIVEILQNAPNLKILVTSRERLNLQEEWILQVHGMETPSETDFEGAEDFPAMQLLLERARKVKPDFALSESDKRYAVRVCHLLEGVPLGIELAAAWVRMLSCEEIATEIEQNLDFLTSSLRNVSKRHRSLRAVFEYSWNLLAEAERDVFSKLTVFRGGFSRQTAAKVAGASLFHLSTLVDKSLLQKKANGRYEMLEVLKQYGSEKLAESPQRKLLVQDRHGTYFTEFLHRRKDALKGGEQKKALDEIGSDIENVRLACHWAIANRKYTILSKALDGIYRFYEIRGWIQEGSEVLDRMGESLRERYGGTKALEEDMLLLYSKVLARQGAFYYRLGLHDEAESVLRKSIFTARPLGAQKELAFALTYQGAVAYLQQNYSRARELLQESLSINKETGDRLGTAIALHHLGLIARDLDEFAKARQLFQESLEVNRGVGNRFGIAISLNNLGMVARELGQHEEAQGLHQDSLTIRRELNDRWGIANSLDGLGLVAYEMGSYTKAKMLLDESAEIYEEIGDQRRLERTLENLTLVLKALGDNEKNN
ncbi:MAG: tetratricopeptide repeat protein [Anaerolineales bacterium]